jgi:hypothetical protein
VDGERGPESDQSLTYLFSARRDQLGFVSISIVLPGALVEQKMISPNWTGKKKRANLRDNGVYSGFIRLRDGKGASKVLQTEKF